MTAATRVLVAIVTYDGEEPYLDTLLAALAAQTCQAFDLLFIDNSIAEAYAATLREALAARFPGRFSVERVAAGGERFERILRSRRRAREAFLERDHRYLWWLDSDVIPPPEALARLREALAAEPDRGLVTGCYLVGKEAAGRPTLLPPILLDLGGGAARQATIGHLLGQERLEIGAAGLGCTLATRAVLEGVPLRLNRHGTGEDILFYRDAVAQGARPLALCGVRCQHLHFPPGDARNDPYDLRRYRLE